MGLYDLACAAGPTLGPIVAGFAVVANGWRWAFWEMLWITGFALALLSFSMPEVSLSSPPCSFHLRLLSHNLCLELVYWRGWYRVEKVHGEVRWYDPHLRIPTIV
jgi:MFS family permease